MFAKVSVATLTLLAAFASMSHSAPLDVYNPPLVKPAAGDTWPVGTRQLVKWDVSHPPAQITNRTGTIYISRGGRLLDYDSPLDYGFDIMAGERWVTVPPMPTAYDYQLVLMGDSGNTGPKKIQGN
ncbi:hypothetical protein AN958_00499 [Leucoagaricus sp. SymC.cos]|nr:hypothetical protein AN958_00499 [Leucoagaricus sp. SymC.cos]